MVRGKADRSLDPASDDREEILKLAMGPSGKLRAPTLRRGKDFLIGFQQEAYEDWL